MRILLTGAAGFIGYHTSKALCARGHSVVGIDNLNTYYDTDLKLGRLEQMEGVEGFTFIKLDLCDKEGLASLFKQFHFDAVCHLAAQAGVRYSFENPKAYFDSNIIGFENIISLAADYHIPHFIYASSSSVYGKNKKVPFSESDHLEGQVSLYAQTKRHNEIEARVVGLESGLHTTGLRFFTVYGPWGRPDMAPMIFMDSIWRERPIKVFNYGEMWRDFTYIDDIVDGVVKVVETPPAEVYRIFNIGNGSPIYLKEFISIIEKVVGKTAIKEEVAMQPGDVIKTFSDTSRLEKCFGIKPRVGIEEGINRLWAWYKKFYSFGE